jgi:hypothetical protein
MIATPHQALVLFPPSLHDTIALALGPNCTQRGVCLTMINRGRNIVHAPSSVDTIDWLAI